MSLPQFRAATALPDSNRVGANPRPRSGVALLITGAEIKHSYTRNRPCTDWIVNWRESFSRAVLFEDKVPDLDTLTAERKTTSCTSCRCASSPSSASCAPRQRKQTARFRSDEALPAEGISGPGGSGTPLLVEHDDGLEVVSVGSVGISPKGGRHGSTAAKMCTSAPRATASGSNRPSASCARDSDPRIGAPHHSSGTSHR